MKTKGPTVKDVASELGPAQAVWDAISAALAERFKGLALEWKPSKSSFGWMCLAKHKKKTLLYMTPDKGKIQAAVVLGERAAGAALASGLPEAIKDMIRQARPYAEGRGIRFPVSSAADVDLVAELVAVKTAPK